MTQTIALFIGKPSKKRIVDLPSYSVTGDPSILNGEYTVKPFAGLSDEYHHYMCGVGIIFDDKEGNPNILRDTRDNIVSEGPNIPPHYMQGTNDDPNLVTLYRGMQLAQEVPTIHPGWHERGTLEQCYAAAMEGVDWNTDLVEKIQGAIGESRFRDIMNSPLPSDEFDLAIRKLQTMESVLKESDMEFDPQPLLREIERGTLQRTPTIDKLVANYIPATG